MELKDEIIQKCHHSKDENIQKIPDSIKNTLLFLDSLPHELVESYMDHSVFKKVMRNDKCTGQIIYWEEMEKRIEYLWKTMGFRGFALLESFVSCANAENYYAATIVLRSLLENASLLHFYVKKIKPFNDNWNEQGVMGRIIRKETHAIFVSEELEDFLIKYSHGTTLKDLKIEKPKWAIESIGKIIKEVATETEFSRVYDYYSVLCQVAHPSIGSNLIFGVKAIKSGDYEEYFFSRKQNLEYFLHTIAYPLVFSCYSIVENIKQLQTFKFT